MWKWADDKTKGRGSWNWVPGPSLLFITWHGRFSRDWEIFAGKGGVTRQRGVLLWQVKGDHCGQVRCRIVNCRCVCFVPGYEDPEDCGITMCSSVHVHENRVWTIIISVQIASRVTYSWNQSRFLLFQTRRRSVNLKWRARRPRKQVISEWCLM